MIEHRRIITRDVFDHLDPLEQIIAQKFILEGRWILQEENRG